MNLESVLYGVTLSEELYLYLFNLSLNNINENDRTDMPILTHLFTTKYVSF